MDAPGTSDTASNNFTDEEYDRLVITQARQLAPLLRNSTGDRDRLAGWLLAELADLAERLDGPR